MVCKKLLLLHFKSGKISVIIFLDPTTTHGASLPIYEWLKVSVCVGQRTGLGEYVCSNTALF